MTEKGIVGNAKQWVIMATMLLGLPLAGILLAGRDPGDYLEFPPLTLHVWHAPFSWWAFLVFALIDLLFITSIGYLFKSYRGCGCAFSPGSGRWPAWGWAGALILPGGWILAWTRWEWFTPWQAHTFCLPWVGYILLVNAWCLRRSARSLLTDAPVRFALLIPASALFWWFFEYLNRFVQNWYYVGVADFSPLAYIVFASLAFATVLPAVLSTHRLLLSFPLVAGLDGLPALRVARPRAMAAGTLIVAAAGLALLGVFPDALFALLWVSPLLIITALQALGGRPTIFAPLRHGDGRPLVASVLAALICGFFWELWNFGSLAQWRYAVPYVDRFHIFAMPVLGYGGYLPFGLECLVMGVMVMGQRALDIAGQESAGDLRSR
jgi:hypothetical membrane protein